MVSNNTKDIGVQELLDAGLHFGHQTKRWNPKMKRYIHGAKNGIYIIDLNKTLSQLELAKAFLRDVVLRGEKILFVGTKRSASRVIKEEAERCNMPYVNYRWLGGMLTNFKTVRASIRRLEILKTQEEEGKFDPLTKKEVLGIKREMDKLERSIGGIKNMGGLPEALFVVDVKNEKIAVSEARKMGIPIIGIVDTNSDPDSVDYVIPGNDDAIRSVSLLTRIISNACLEGASKATGIVSGDGPVIVRKGEENKKTVTEEEKKSVSPKNVEKELNMNPPESLDTQEESKENIDESKTSE